MNTHVQRLVPECFLCNEVNLSALDLACQACVESGAVTEPFYRWVDVRPVWAFIGPFNCGTFYLCNFAQSFIGFICRAILDELPGLKAACLSCNLQRVNPAITRLCGSPVHRGCP